MKVYKSESTQRPAEWDTTSSETAVYHNENIEVIPASEDRPQMYAYDVTEMSYKEYSEEILGQQRADIDYIAMETGVEL